MPCVLRRFELTFEAMKNEKVAHSERWAEQTRVCLGRALDNQASLFRNNDTKFLRCRAMVQEIERHYEEVRARGVRCS